MKKLLAGLTAFLSAVLAVGSQTFLRPCVHEDGSASVCTPAGTLLLVFGVAAAVLSLARLAGVGRGTRLLLSALTLAAGVLIILTPGVLSPLCMMETMRCRMITKPAAQVAGTLIALLSAGDLLRIAAGRKERK